MAAKYDPNWYAKSRANALRSKAVDNDTLPTPLFFAEIFDGESVWFEPVRLCIKRHPGEWVDHFHKSYTYIFNDAHIDMRQDGILRIHYVETKSRLAEVAPDHPLLSR